MRGNGSAYRRLREVSFRLAALQTGEFGERFPVIERIRPVQPEEVDVLACRFDRSFPPQTWDPGPDLANKVALARAGYGGFARQTWRPHLAPGSAVFQEGEKLARRSRSSRRV